MVPWYNNSDRSEKPAEPADGTKTKVETADEIKIKTQEMLLEARHRLTRKAIELAEEGNLTALMFLLDRLLPKQPLLELKLPQLELALDAVDAHAAIQKAVQEGQIAIGEGKALASLVEAFRHAARDADAEDTAKRRASALERRMTLMEEALAKLCATKQPPHR
jgi:hypothetical protein